MAYQKFELTHNRFEVRCAPGDIVHVAYDGVSDTYTVEEDPEHRTFQNKGDALDRARVIGKDPDMFK